MKTLILILFGFILLGLSSCDGCKYAATYSVNSGTQRGRMIYGHDNDGVVAGKFSKTPYSNNVKPKREHWHNYNNR